MKEAFEGHVVCSCGLYGKTTGTASESLSYFMGRVCPKCGETDKWKLKVRRWVSTDLDIFGWFGHWEDKP